MKKYKPNAFSDLAKSAIARHGIGRQVQSSMIVQSAAKHMQELLAGTFTDKYRVLSHKNDVLRIYLQTPLIIDTLRACESNLMDRIHSDFPAVQIKRIEYTFNE